MAFECNIDAKGKAIRLFGGIFSLILGLIISSIAYFDLVEVAYLWVAAAGLLAGGTLGVFAVSYTHLTLPTKA